MAWAKRHVDQIVIHADLIVIHWDQITIHEDQITIHEDQIKIQEDRITTSSDWIFFMHFVAAGSFYNIYIRCIPRAWSQIDSGWCVFLVIDRNFSKQGGFVTKKVSTAGLYYYLWPPLCARARHVFSPYFLHQQIIYLAQIVAGRKCIGYDFHMKKAQNMDFFLRDGSFPWWMELRFRLRGCWPPARCDESATFDPFDFYRTRGRSLGMPVTNLLTHSLTHCCLVNLIDVSLDWCEFLDFVQHIAADVL